MKMKLKYFGMIAEALSNHEEELSFDEDQTVAELKNQLEHKYPRLKTMDYRVAVNHTLAEPDFSITPDSEIALLPPFAGG